MTSTYRYLATSSATVILIAMILVHYFHHRSAVENMVSDAELQNIALARVLSNEVWEHYAEYMKSVGAQDAESLISNPETKQIDAMLRRLTEGQHVLKAKVYGIDGVTLYSSEFSQIGERKPETDAAFSGAARFGRSASKLSARDRFSAFSGELFDRDIVETYVPVRLDGDRIVGVFELYTDVTEVKNRIDRSTLGMVVVLTIIFAALYAVLILVVVRRAMVPLRRASSAASRITAGSSDIRLPTDDVPGEIVPMMTAVNGALDRLDQALAAQRRFTGYAAHELLTPIAVLSTHLENIKDAETAAQLRQEVQDLSDIVTQLLELAEVEALQPDEHISADLYAVCVDVVSALAPLAFGQGKEIALTGSETPVHVRCNDKYLNRALGNLITNAIANSPGGSKIEVRVAADGTVKVIDQGPGIPPEDRERVFESFWRGAKSAYKGTGLGLSIVKHFVTAYRGSIDIQDAPGGGTIFTLGLPLSKTR